MKVLIIDPLVMQRGINRGIAYCSASLRRNGHTVSVLDMNNIREGDSRLRLESAIKTFRPDMVGISIHSLSSPNSVKIMKTLRDFYAGPIIVGGPEASVQKENIFHDSKEADFVCVGEGEETFPELAFCLEKGGDISQIKGIIFRSSGGEIIATPPRPINRDLDSIPFPDFEVFGVKEMTSYALLTSRGCPYNCSFCTQYLGRTWRKRDPARCIEELRWAKDKYKVKAFGVNDPCFNLLPSHVEEFCDLLSSSGINLPWTTLGIRADKIRESTIRQMARAGCRKIVVGIESLNPEVFKMIDKGETIEQIKEGIRLAQGYGIQVYGFLIVGLPGDTFQRALASFEEVRKLNLDGCYYSTAMPFYGTRLNEWVQKNATVLYSDKFIPSRGEFEKVPFETPEFTAAERLKALKILSIRSKQCYRFHKEKPILLQYLEALGFILAYDRRYLFSHISSFLKRKLLPDKDPLSLYLNYENLTFGRIPDGTWGLS